jgi:GH25 family lysozyme M1 (1,4-beta-N-acetylmuramidase)
MSEPPSLPPFLPDLYHGDDACPDWGALAAAEHFAGAILKATDGTTEIDAAWFAHNWPALRAAGGDRYGASWFRGAYHFLRFTIDGAAQADAYASAIERAGGWDAGDLVPIVDVELDDGETVEPQQIMEVTAAWAARINAVLGAPVMLYRNAVGNLDGVTSRMGCDHLWAKRYNHAMGNTQPIGWMTAEVALWQYTDGDSNFTPWPTRAPGLKGGDLSAFLGGDVAALAAALCWLGRSSN